MDWTCYFYDEFSKDKWEKICHLIKLIKIWTKIGVDNS